MNRKQLKLAVAAGVLALAGSLGVAGATYAQTGTRPTADAPSAQRGPHSAGPDGQTYAQAGVHDAALGQPGPMGPAMHGPQLDQPAIAKALSMDDLALATALKSGKTVADLAKDKGVALDTVIQAVIDAHVTQLKKDLPERFSKVLPPPRAGDPGDGHGPRDGGPFGELSSAVSKTLGIDAVTLRTTLESGKTPADLAKDKGVSIDTVASAFVDAHKAHLDAEVTAGKWTQAQADADLARFKTDVLQHLSESRPAGPPPAR